MTKAERELLLSVAETLSFFLSKVWNLQMLDGVTGQAMAGDHVARALDEKINAVAREAALQPAD